MGDVLEKAPVTGVDPKAMWVKKVLKIDLSSSELPMPKAGRGVYEWDAAFARAQVAEINTCFEYASKTAKGAYSSGDVGEYLSARLVGARQSIKDAKTEEERDRFGEEGLKAITREGKTFREEFLADGGKSFLAAVGKQRTEAQDTQNLSVERQQFATEWKKVETALGGLYDYSAPESERIGAKAEKAKTQIIAESKYELGMRFITATLEEIRTAQLQAQKGAKVSGDQLEREIAKLREEVKAQEKAIGPKLAGPYKALVAEIGQIDIIAKTGNRGAHEAGLAMIAKIREAVTGPGAAKILAFNTALKEVEAVSGDGDIAKQHETEANELKLALKTVLEDVDLLNFGPSLTGIQGLQKDAEALGGTNALLDTWRAGVKKRLEALKKINAEMRKSLEKEKEFKGKETSIDVALKEIEKGYKAVGVDAAAMETQLSNAERLAWSAANGLKSGNVKKEVSKVYGALRLDIKTTAETKQTQQDEAAEQEKTRKALEKELKTYDTDLKGVTKTITELVKKKQPGDEEEASELKILGEQAQKKFKAGDYEEARKQLDAIRKRLDLLIRTPGGVAASSVRDLANIDTLWGNAFQVANNLLKGIKSSAEPARKAAELETVDVQKPMDVMLERLQAFTLPDSVKVLADEKADLKARKKAREDALRDIRAMRAILTGDPVVRKLAANPFGVRQPMLSVMKLLENIEFNSLRAVPPE